jgi:hypothetical protein
MMQHTTAKNVFFIMIRFFNLCLDTCLYGNISEKLQQNPCLIFGQERIILALAVFFDLGRYKK